ncbi:hypothetical protein NCU09977 [Neurospora crassa OR74A]|uniref:Uncharacterized protein n=1 Tax=Neurospora crassa (strain ATCC 24698 / 74-OR23-1A / CBS 708.71 / DSM 1257 / FGSC 987) TaxID=367110 RepID=Q7S0K9_NEUCR|nr:hypothetical protein NCU09977 [Neurospora crassa OR74A]EAA28859.2 hypothetical protein NCU09977 [Neurospora crassa OR74A]|eukprot:XP_958095.2 hypothetical protein NCU09977 [Neurospora crassa OR74A]
MAARISPDGNHMVRHLFPLPVLQCLSDYRGPGRIAPEHYFSPEQHLIINRHSVHSSVALRLIRTPLAGFWWWSRLADPLIRLTTANNSSNSGNLPHSCRSRPCHRVHDSRGRADLVAAYPFVSTVHLVGRAVTPSEDRQLNDKFSRWDNHEMIECEKFYNSWWPEMPWLMAPHFWIPGEPGTQVSLPNQRACLHVRSPLRPDLSRPICAPQRAVLDHPSTTLCVTHAGPSSANEALFHGDPMVSMPFYGDQIQHSLCLVAAGVAKGVDKDTFTPAQLASTISAMMVDSDGEMHIMFIGTVRFVGVTAGR